ncbi:ATP-grasp domain-containing protein [Nocardiopsis sp. NRRL B-16309]|uniref:ATP-grasp domain-containing protein n=1 Tax=Nocardiopsis sp. NRRL B-16309 TaxID=1519494 RepID=UPI0006AD8C0F|nr:ATP-grasp domain-containing protein [Nocardiopsis sp. NRRL B-16309]KOX11244.1 hypothetical protein ADL05_23685 [Nocardiopsis sp. NRRL B-16309]
MGRPYLRRAHERNLDVAILDSPEAFTWPETQAALTSSDTTYPVAGRDHEAWLSAASSALGDGPVRGVIAFSEPHVVAASMIAEELGLPGPGVRAALTSRNKVAQRELFARRGVPQPRHHVARDVEGALAWVDGAWPVVAKPVSGSGSAGVRIVGDEAGLRDWFAERTTDEPVLVEEYLSGPEFSIEAVTDRGRVVFSSVTAKTTTSPPLAVETEHRMPVEQDTGDLLAEVVDALGMGSGILHLEFRSEPEGPRVMEVAVRTPGDYILDGVQAATGVDLYDAVIAVACGEEVPEPRVSGGTAAIWFPTPEPGEVVKVEGAEAVSAREGVVKVEIDVEPGGTVNPLRSSMDRVGVVIVRADSSVELESRLKTVQEELRFHTKTSGEG